MTYYLRDKNNKTLVDIEVKCNKNLPLNSDLSVAVVINNYSEFLLASKNQQQVINDFDEISELRGLWFEQKCGEWENINEFTNNYLHKFVEKYDLIVVMD